MQPNELKALLAKTNEVAIRPVHVEIDVPNYRPKKGPWRGRLQCPIGLIKATVVKNGYEWIEKRPLAACGDQDYEIKRRNGVLVEINPDDANSEKHSKNFVIKGKRVLVKGEPYKHAEVVTRDGKKYVHLITSRKAIFSSWGEYSLEVAKREAIAEREKREWIALREPQAALMGFSSIEEFNEAYKNSQSNGLISLDADYAEIYKRDANGDYIYVDNEHGWARPAVEKKIGRIQITIDQANKILDMLTPAQKRKLAQ